jgi:hypothetical protein
MAINAPPVRLIGQPAAGYQEVEYRGPRLTVRGFVPAGAIETGGFGHASVGGRDVRHLHRKTARLPEATCLYAGRDGEVIGWVTRDTIGPAGADVDDDSWWYVGMASPWGTFDAWIHDSGAPPRSGIPDGAEAPAVGGASGPVPDAGDSEQRPWTRCALPPAR